MKAVNSYSKLDCREAPTLFYELHGTPAGAKEQAELAREIAEEGGCLDFQWAADLEERSKLWRARHDAYWAGKSLRPGTEGWATDVCVPISQLADCILETKKDVAATGLIAPIVGHVGDGNFHLLLLVDPEDTGEQERAKALLQRLVERALSVGGTSTGEHGIGVAKLAFLEAEHGSSAVKVMRRVKDALDPHDLMNPGKTVPR